MRETGSQYTIDKGWGVEGTKEGEVMLQWSAGEAPELGPDGRAGVSRLCRVEEHPR